MAEGFDPVQFGRNVAAARTQLGLKPKELAAHVGVHVATIYRIERGERDDVRRPELEALARALSTSEEALLGDGSDEAGQPELVDRLLEVLREHADKQRDRDEALRRELAGIHEQLRRLAAERAPT